MNMNLSRDVSLYLISRAIIFSANLFGFLFLVRELGAAVIGSYYIFTSIMRLIFQSTSIGIGKSITKLTAERESSYAFSGFLTMAPVLIIFCLIISFNSSFISEFVGYNEAPLYLIASIWLSSISESFFASLKGETKVGSSGILDGVGKSIEVMSQVFLVLLGLKIQSLFIGIIIGYAARIVLFYSRLSYKLRLPSLENIKRIKKFSKSSYFDEIISGKPLWIDLIMIGLFLDRSQAGVYGTLWKIGFVVVMFSESLGESIFPRTSKTDEKTVELLETALKYSTFLAIPFVAGGIAIGNEVLVLVGSAFPKYKAAFLVIALSSLVLSVHNNIIYSLYGQNKPDISLKIHLIGLAANIGFNLYLLRYFGVTGIAAGSLIATVVTAILSIGYTKETIQSSFQSKTGFYRLFRHCQCFVY
ncbi:MAG: membrane protein involved in the export of O-antigen and teichoic acid [Candidatus Nanosalina sp. J07AB43]|nr:MAG: membrane protein involved in the export of O-antigen and teichoic acid [Candidatus Nanosalina sp. J07AB43]